MIALIAALTVAAPVAVTAWVALHATRPRARHARTRDEMAADAWTQVWRPGPGDRATVLRLRRDLRRWIPRRKLP